MLDVTTLQTRQQVDSAGMRLTVNQLSYGKVPTEAVLNGTAKPVEAILTMDGRHADLSQWHDPDSTSEDAVYFERWSLRGRESHGWIDAASRKVVQTG